MKMSVASLLNLEFFKSVGFTLKTEGVCFVNENAKLKRMIEEKVSEYEEAKYCILESIRTDVFPKFNVKKDVYLMKVKGERQSKLEYKKSLQKEVLKESLREELKREIKEDARKGEIEKMCSKYPKAYCGLLSQGSYDDSILRELFVKVMLRKNKEELTVLEKTCEQVNRALAVLKKAERTLTELVEEV